MCSLALDLTTDIQHNSQHERESHDGVEGGGCESLTSLASDLTGRLLGQTAEDEIRKRNRMSTLGKRTTTVSYKIFYAHPGKGIR